MAFRSSTKRSASRHHSTTSVRTTARNQTLPGQERKKRGKRETPLSKGRVENTTQGGGATLTGNQKPKTNRPRATSGSRLQRHFRKKVHPAKNRKRIRGGRAGSEGGGRQGDHSTKKFEAHLSWGLEWRREKKNSRTKRDVSELTRGLTQLENGATGDSEQNAQNRPAEMLNRATPTVTLDT